MGLLTGFEHDVFISYSHADDLRGMADPGWVGTFAKYLNEGIEGTLNSHIRTSGRQLDIFWDYKLELDQPITERLRDAVQNSATFLMIMSKNYLASDWCGEEAAWFCEIVKSRRGSLHSIDASRQAWPLVVVEVGPTNREDWPDDLIREVPGYQFFKKDTRSGEDPRFGYPNIDRNPSDDKYFWSKFNKIQSGFSGKFRRILERESEHADDKPLGGNSNGSQKFEPDGKVEKKSVAARSVLTLASDDQSKKLEQLRASLGDACVETFHLPEDQGDVSGRDAALHTSVSTTDTMVFILGSYPGSDEKVNEFLSAFELAQDQGKSIWVWLPKKFNADTIQDLIDDDFGEYREFVAEIFASADHANLTVNQSSFAEFGEELAGALTKSVSDKERIGVEVDLYIDADRVDQPLALHIQGALRKRNLNVVSHLPIEEVSEEKLANRQKLMEGCDGAILVYGNIDEESIHFKYRQIRKCSSRRRRDKKAEISVAIMDGPPRPPISLVAPNLKIIACEKEDIGEEQIEEIVQFISEIADRQATPAGE